MRLGASHLLKHEYAAAVAAFSAARKEDPSSPDALLGLGQVAYGQGRYAEAVTQFRAALRLAPTSSTLHVWLGHALLGSNRKEEAEEAYRAALAYEPDNAIAKQGLEAARRK